MEIRELFNTVHCPECGEPAQKVSGDVWRCDDCSIRFVLSPQEISVPAEENETDNEYVKDDGQFGAGA